MYLPKHFEVSDQSLLWQLMQEFNFALLVTAPNGLPFASAVPFVVNREQNLLSTHLAKANPQWKHLEPNREVLIVFPGRARVDLEPLVRGSSERSDLELRDGSRLRHASRAEC